MDIKNCNPCHWRHFLFKSVIHCRHYLSICDQRWSTGDAKIVGNGHLIAIVSICNYCPHLNGNNESQPCNDNDWFFVVIHLLPAILVMIATAEFTVSNGDDGDYHHPANVASVGDLNRHIAVTPRWNHLNEDELRRGFHYRCITIAVNCRHLFYRREIKLMFFVFDAIAV